jgi:hypothetical protein
VRLAGKRGRRVNGRACGVVGAVQLWLHGLVRTEGELPQDRSLELCFSALQFLDEYENVMERRGA